MNNYLRDDMNHRFELISNLVREIEKKITNYPSGRLVIRHRKNSLGFYLAGSDSNDRYLNKSDIKLIEKTAQKNYLEKVLRVSQKELCALKKMMELYPDTFAEDVFDLLTEERKKLIKPIVMPDELYVKEWLNKPYKPKEIREGIPFYLTMNGERVRSKSEMIIADRLYTNGIPYKYECPIQIMGKVYHPDFTILKISTRKNLYLEHNGKIDDPDYKNDFVTRINDFNLAGIRQGDNLFLTFESSNIPFDVRTIDNMINTQFK